MIDLATHEVTEGVDYLEPKNWEYCTLCGAQRDDEKPWCSHVFDAPRRGGGSVAIGALSSANWRNCPHCGEEIKK